MLLTAIFLNRLPLYTQDYTPQNPVMTEYAWDSDFVTGLIAVGYISLSMHFSQSTSSPPPLSHIRILTSHSSEKNGRISRILVTNGAGGVVSQLGNNLSGLMRLEFIGSKTYAYTPLTLMQELPRIPIYNSLIINEIHRSY